MKLVEKNQMVNLKLNSVHGEEVLVPDSKLLVHLQFRRYADCPICNTHVGELLRRTKELSQAGIKEVLFFHSPAKDIRSFQKNVPLTFIADPEKKYYKEFSVESSPFFLDLPAFGAALRGMAKGKMGMTMSGGPTGLPAEFLIAPSGEIVAAKYGKHAYDQWSVDELLSIAKSYDSQRTGANTITQA